MPAVRLLILEDLATDLELLLDQLRRSGLDFDFRHVTDEDGFRRELRQFQPDIILSDYRVPGFDGMSALAVRNLEKPGLPFIFVTGTLGEERAVETLLAGATDYVLKDRLARLPAAIRRVAEESRLAAEAEAERALHGAIVDTTEALIVTLDEQGAVLRANPAAVCAAGLAADAISGGVFWEMFVIPEHAEACRQRLMPADNIDIESEPSWEALSPTRRNIVWTNTRLIPSRHPKARHVLCGLDITDQERAREQAYFLDHFDAHTSLPNRKLFSLQLRQRCENTAPHDAAGLAVLCISIGRLAEIQDSYGSPVAQRILLELVSRLKTWQIRQELLGRTGENRFALAFGVGNPAELDKAVPFIIAQLGATVDIDGQQWVLPVHAGVARRQSARQSGEELLLAAEAALHEAEGRREPYVIYEAKLAVRIRERLLLETELHAAIRDPDQFIVHYQPQVDAQGYRLIGLEALVRWRHPRLGLLLPGRFIPVAENAGCMAGIGRIVLHEVCRQIRRWQQDGLEVPTLAINVSATEFTDVFLADAIREALHEFGIDRELIEVEITESASMSNPENTITILSSLRKMGIRIAIDDFGTGYSNLSYLKRFPIQRLKLDQAFVRNILLDRNDLAICQAVIAVAHQLKLEVIAEGVEDPGQLALLQNAGCDQIQGFLFGAPVPGPECRAWLRDGRITPANLRQPD